MAFASANERETDSVERSLDADLVDFRHAHERRAFGSLRRGDHSVERFEADGAMFLIDDDAVGARRGDRLGDDRRGDDAHMHIQPAPRFGRLCFQSHLRGCAPSAPALTLKSVRNHNAQERAQTAD
jgi:hypothetical protein